MFFGSAPDHLQKHLLDSTRKAFNKMSTGNGMNALDEFSAFSAMAKAGAKLETFDTGPALLQAEDPRDGRKVEITVESDNLSGDEDQIELALHMSKNGKEESLPFTPRVMFDMEMESEIWRLNEISFTVSGHPMLAPAAMNAVRQWKYRPYLLQGKPVQVETQVTVNFTLVP